MDGSIFLAGASFGGDATYSDFEGSDAGEAGSVHKGPGCWAAVGQSLCSGCKTCRSNPAMKRKLRERPEN